MGVHSAAQLCRVTKEDYPILGICSAKDRTQLLLLVQMLKSFDLHCEAHDSECDSSDSDKNHHEVGDVLTSCLGPDGDVYDLPGVGKRLDFSGKRLSHHHKRSCYPARVHVSARHDRNAQAGQRKEAAGPQFVTRCLELKGKSNSWIDYHDTKTDPRRNSTSRPPHISSHKLSYETLPSTQLSTRLVWQQEQKKSSKNEKLRAEKNRRKTLEQKTGIIPVYESRRVGYNYGLPLSSPVPNKRWVNNAHFHHPQCVCYKKKTYCQVFKGLLTWWSQNNAKNESIKASLWDQYHRINGRLFLFELRFHWLIQQNGIFFISVIFLCELQETVATADHRMCEKKTSDSHWVQERRRRCRDNFERSVCDCKRKERDSISLPVCPTGTSIIYMLIFKEKAIVCLIGSNVSTKCHQCSTLLAT